jgi:hypothetical protein
MAMQLAWGAKRRASVASCLALGMFLAGCTQKGGDGPSAAQTNMQNLMRLRNNYMGKHMGRDPASEEEFKKYAKGLKPEELKDMGITDIDACFVSPRDKQPYVINYGAKFGTQSGMDKGGKAKEGMAPRTHPPVFAYEKTGSGGKRFVALAMGGSVVEVTEKQFTEEYGGGAP